MPLGVIHFAHEKDPLKLMAAYLPRETNQSSSGGFAEGGSLYALGLIHANHANKKILGSIISRIRVYLSKFNARQSCKYCII